MKITSLIFGLIFVIGVVAFIVGGIFVSDIPLSLAETQFVLSTTAPVESLVGFLCEGIVKSECLIGENSDPHNYQLVKGDSDKLLYSRLIFCNGLGLEHGPSVFGEFSSFEKVFSFGDWLIANTPQSIIIMDGLNDPHIWMDVGIFISLVDPICDRLCKEFPDSEEIFRKRCVELKLCLRELDDQVRGIISQIPAKRRILVTAHDAFNYFARAYLVDKEGDNLDSWKDRVASPEGFAPEGQVCASQLHFTSEFIRENNVGAVFPEVNVSRRVLERVLEICGDVDVRMSDRRLYSDGFPLGADNLRLSRYAYMLLWNARVIKEELCK